jgi:hypothetical protein
MESTHLHQHRTTDRWVEGYGGLRVHDLLRELACDFWPDSNGHLSGFTTNWVVLWAHSGGGVGTPR